MTTTTTNYIWSIRNRHLTDSVIWRRCVIWSWWRRIVFSCDALHNWTQTVYNRIETDVNNCHSCSLQCWTVGNTSLSLFLFLRVRLGA